MLRLCNILRKNANIFDCYQNSEPEQRVNYKKLKFMKELETAQMEVITEQHAPLYRHLNRASNCYVMVSKGR